MTLRVYYVRCSCSPRLLPIGFGPLPPGDRVLFTCDRCKEGKWVPSKTVRYAPRGQFRRLLWWVWNWPRKVTWHNA